MLHPCHLTADKMSSIDPVGYSVTFEAAQYKQYWTVSLIGNVQAHLTDCAQKPIRFETKEKAEAYCSQQWPELRAI
jgi:hypothetical protein